jgi:hypothetical protein
LDFLEYFASTIQDLFSFLQKRLFKLPSREFPSRGIRVKLNTVQIFYEITNLGALCPASLDF